MRGKRREAALGAAVELWASLESLELGGSISAAGIESPITGVVWPASLQQLSFGRDFNHPIAGVAWPASLQRLSFSSHHSG
eukprot:g15460.t1